MFFPKIGKWVAPKFKGKKETFSNYHLNYEKIENKSLN